MDETIIRETTEYIDSLENRIKELELEIREAGVEFTPTDFEKLQEETAGDE
jgi:hypothetical protein